MPQYKSQRLSAFKAQKGLCYYCSFPMWIKSPAELSSNHQISQRSVAKLKCTAEHLIAKSNGGNDSKNNIVAACYHCNSTRHKAKKPLEHSLYQRYVLKRIKNKQWHTSTVWKCITIMNA